MVSRFGAPPASEDELAALFEEAQRRGVNIGPALALAASPEEAVANIKTRLAAEARPGVQQVRENVRANYPLLAGGPERATPQEAFYGAPFRHLGPAIPFTQSVVPEPALKRLPDFLEEMTRQITTPFGLATLPFSPQRTVLAAGGSVAAPRVVKAAGGGPTAQTVAGIGGGIIAGGPEIIPAVAKLGVRGAQAAGRGGAKLAEEVGKTNVGNVFLPRAPERVAQPLIYEGLTPAERRLLQQTGLKPAEMRDLEGARDLIYGSVDPATGARTGNIVSAEDASRIQQLEQDIGEIAMSRTARADELASSEGLRSLLDRGLLRDFNMQQAKGRGDATTFRWHGKGLDEIAQEVLPEHEWRQGNASEILIDRLSQLREGGRGLSSTATSRARQEIDVILSKYAEPEAPATTGPIAQAGFGGEMGPGQVARGAAEQARMTQAPLSEIAASEADRIAKGRTPISQEPPAGPHQAAASSPSAPAGAGLPASGAAPATEPGFVDVGTGPDASAERFARLKQGTPRAVLTSRPRYRDVEPRFESDFDKAVYIVTNPGASKRHPEIAAWVQANAPEGFDVSGAGTVIRAKLKSLYKPGQPLEVRGQTVGKTLDDAAAPTIQGKPFTKPLGGPTDVPRQQQPPNLLAGTREPVPPTTGIQPSSVGPVPQQGRFTPPGAPVSQAVPSAGPVPTQPPLVPPPPPPRPPTGQVGGPPTPPPPQGILSGMQRPSIAGNIIGLRDIDTGLTRGEELQNVLLGAGRKARLPFRVNNQYGTAAIREKERVSTAITSQATQLAHRQAVGIRQAFKLEDDLFVPSLAGKVARVKGAPSIQDIADYYPKYEPFLTDAQKAAIKPIVDTHGQYTDLLNKVGVGFPSRASTQIGGGSYIARVARGLASQQDNVRSVPARGLFASAKKGFEQEIHFETAAEGRAAGIKYAGIEDTLRFHYQQAGQRATEAHIANYLTTAVDDTNWPISLPRKGEMGRKAVDLAVLADYSFPEAIADSINKVLVSQGSTVGQGRNLLEAVRILNNGYRGVRATLDNSYMGIQALLSAYSHPVAASKATKLNFQAWKDPKVLARFMDSFDAKAPSTGRLTSTQWVSDGNLHLGATTGEFAVEGLQKVPVFKQAGRAYGFTGDGLRLEVADSLLEQEMHGFKLFGKGPELFGKGRTLDEIRASGDLAKIGEIANNMTGVARARTGGDLGELLLFAPRFLQSRLETVAKGLAGMRPSAGLEQKIARRSLLKMIVIGTALTVAINELNGEETDFRPIVNGRKNPNFMRIRALGRDWSLFGTWDSLAGLLIAAGHGDVEGAVRSQASGLVTTTWDQASGSDFIGRSTVSPENKAIYVLRQLTPFSGEQTVSGLESALSGEPKDIAAGAVTAASTLAGAKSSPLSFTDHANEIAQAKYGTTWDRLKAERDAALKAAVDKGKASSPEYARLDATMDKIADAVDKQYPKEATPNRITLQGKREEMAQRLYGRGYEKLYPNQRASINKKINQKTGVSLGSRKSSIWDSGFGR